jgi:hypothetical protein
MHTGNQHTGKNLVVTAEMQAQEAPKGEAAQQECSKRREKRSVQ